MQTPQFAAPLMLKRRKRDPGVAPAMRLAAGKRRGSRNSRTPATTTRCGGDKEPHRARKRRARGRVVEVREYDDETTVLQERADGECGAHRIGFRRLHVQAPKGGMQARDRAQTALRRTHRERPVGKHDEPHAIIVGGCELRKTRGNVGVQAEAIQRVPRAPG